MEPLFSFSVLGLSSTFVFCTNLDQFSHLMFVEGHKSITALKVILACLEVSDTDSVLL